MKSARRGINTQLLWLLGAAGFFAFSAYGSVVPLDYHAQSLAKAWSDLAGSLSALGKGSSRVDWGVNVLLLVPASYCLMGALSPANPGFTTKIAISSGVLLGCFAFSLLIELSQSWFPPRVPSLLDVAAQWCGALVGVALWWLTGQQVVSVLADLGAEDIPQNRIGLLLLIYAVGLMFMSLAPLDLTLRPGELLRKFREGRIAFVPFQTLPASHSRASYDLFADICLFVPVGVFAATFLSRRKGTDRSIAHSLLIGMFIVVCIEVLQMIVLSRYSDVTDIITGSIGVALGVFAYRALSTSANVQVRSFNIRQCWLLLGMFVYGLLLLAIFWYPYDFQSEDPIAIRNRFDQFVGIPFARALQGSYLLALDGILRKFLLFVPLGALSFLVVKQIESKYRPVVLALVACLLITLAFVVELGQVLLPRRVAGIDDALVCCVGAAVGYWTVRHWSG